MFGTLYRADVWHCTFPDTCLAHFLTHVWHTIPGTCLAHFLTHVWHTLPGTCLVQQVIPRYRRTLGPNEERTPRNLISCNMKSHLYFTSQWVVLYCTVQFYHLSIRLLEQTMQHEIPLVFYFRVGGTHSTVLPSQHKAFRTNNAT